jgi:hypothetical protein
MRVTVADVGQENAEISVREMLKGAAAKQLKATGQARLFCRDFLDDGSPVVLTVRAAGAGEGAR